MRRAYVLPAPAVAHGAIVSAGRRPRRPVGAGARAGSPDSSTVVRRSRPGTARHGTGRRARVRPRQPRPALGRVVGGQPDGPGRLVGLPGGGQPVRCGGQAGVLCLGRRGGQARAQSLAVRRRLVAARRTAEITATSASDRQHEPEKSARPRAARSRHRARARNSVTTFGIDTSNHPSTVSPTITAPADGDRPGVGAGRRRLDSRLASVRRPGRCDRRAHHSTAPAVSRTSRSSPPGSDPSSPSAFPARWPAPRHRPAVRASARAQSAAPRRAAHAIGPRAACGSP